MAAFPYQMQPVQVPGGDGVPDIRWLKRSDASTFTRGSVVIYSSGEIIIAGADPTGVVGVAMQAAVSGSGTNMGDAITQITGFEQKISVAIANRTTVFGAQIVNNSATILAPAVTDIGVVYGITKQSDGTWNIDRNKTGASARVQVIDIDTFVHSPGIALFKWLEAAITPNP